MSIHALIAFTSSFSSSWLPLILIMMLAAGLVISIFLWRKASDESIATKNLLNAQYRTLNSVVKFKSLEDKLDDICSLIESQIDDALSSVMLADDAGETLKPIASPQLPQSFLQALDGLPISENIGACGSAAATGKAVIVDDMLKDSRFDEFHDLIHGYDLRACWSHPIFSSESKKPVGTFALYFRKPRSPKEGELDLILRSRDLAALIIEQHQQRLKRERFEQHNRSLFTHNPEAVFTFDLEGRFTSVNKAACELMKCSQDDLLGQHYSVAVIEQDLARTNEHFYAARRGIPQRYEICTPDMQGNIHYLHITNMPIIIDGEVTGVHGIALDMTREKQHEERAKILERSVESSTHGLLISDARADDYPTIYANQAFEEITGYSQEDILGKNCRMLQGPDTDQKTRKAIKKALQNNEEISTVIKNYKKDGTPFWNELLISPVKDAHGKVTHFIGLQNDITERIQRQEALEFNASHDPLTHLKNRSALERYLMEWVKSNDNSHNIYILFIDLDGFKPINDSLGHEFGDQVLVETAQRLNNEIVEPNMLARFGGDEFVAVIQDLTDHEQVEVLARKLLTIVGESYKVDDIEVSLSAAIGIASSEESFKHPMELIQRADIAMYEAKKRGGSYIYWHSAELNTNIDQQVAIRAQLQDAIQNNQFELFYQPIMSHDNKIGGVEALIRWKHPIKGYISPAEFIPVAERTGQIIPISEWVLNQACKDVKDLKTLGVNSVSVNFSPIQFYREDFIEKIAETLKTHSIQPGDITVEITENVLVHDTAHITVLLQELRHLGLDVAIDDFGSGFASLRYLNMLPVNKLKIDRSFTGNIHQNAHNAAITRGILGMTTEMKIEVVAEGVETDEEYQYLREHKCDFMQGYLFCRPIPIKELIEWVQNRH
ncbi:sensor domain-containing phosphodiesterase [Kangiella aquimarina]|uniref:EAL domain-containing protein n=1 Tax=Kangiella aquimarina TaxID=261965 RepID=A0ABZ0X480_9GAMM|nr:EAL domain-containing protein [Kangiella aquimarina]WQG85335.1 EAL domain-containing protein [Kangiella aquimarina]